MSSTRPRPVVLYLPDGGDVAPDPRPALPSAPTPAAGRCPPEMVDVSGEFCIDRYEASFVDKATRRNLSAYYSLERRQAVDSFQRFSRMAAEPSDAHSSWLELPLLPSWQSRGEYKAMASSLPGVVPHGYLSALTAKAGCEAAGKRLCSGDEWERACRGQDRQQYPYGSSYQQGVCNVFREAHPSVILHGNASLHHLDPRLNLVESQGKPLLRKTGSLSRCMSKWGDDGIYDMVGNLDEWVADSGGEFRGGFFSRATREGCDARISSHDPSYYDYSLGTRCCR